MLNGLNYCELNVQQQVYSESAAPFKFAYAALRFLCARRMLIRPESSSPVSSLYIYFDSVCVLRERERCVFPELCSLAADLHSRPVFGSLGARGVSRPGCNNI